MGKPAGGDGGAQVLDRGCVAEEVVEGGGKGGHSFSALVLLLWFFLLRIVAPMIRAGSLSMAGETHISELRSIKLQQPSVTGGFQLSPNGNGREFVYFPSISR